MPAARPLSRLRKVTLLLLAISAIWLGGLPGTPAPAEVVPAITGDEHGVLRPVSLDGLGNPNNYGFHRLYQFQGYLWTVSGNTKQGAIIYRSRDGEHWEAVNPPGFDGDLANDSIVSLAWFHAKNDPPGSKGMLYAATFSFRPGTGTNQNGGDIWRGNADAKNPNDIVWENITKDGFGDPDIQAFVGFVVLKDQLYAGTFVNEFPAESGAFIFRTDTGDPNDWYQVAPKGMGDPMCNTDFHLNIVFGDYAYFGTEEAGCLGYKGGEIWRTDGNLIDGQTTLDGWEKVTALPGFGHPWNNNIFGMDVFQGHYYGGTWVWTGGTEIFRAPVFAPHEGVTPVPFAFEQVSLPGLNGDPRNGINIALTHLGDTLYVAGADIAGQSPGYFYRTSGAPLTGTAAEHLTTWSPITAEGFPPAQQTGAILPLDGPFWLETFKGKVYVVVEQGGHTPDGLGQIWVYEPRNVPVIDVTSAARCAEAGGTALIRGTGFDDYQGDAYATLNGVPLSSARWTDTEILAEVPLGAHSGRLAVYRDGQTVKAPGSTSVDHTCPAGSG